jgi:tetratricopeptide (TPR) repeat protein/TolB-like protein
VAVVGFKNLGKPEVEWLSNALSEMLSTELGSTDAVRTISPENVSTAKMDLGLAIVPTYNIATLLKIRRILHSEYVISGAYVAMGSAGGDSIHVDVHLQDADTGEAIFSLGEDGTIANLPELLRKVATDLRNRLGVQDQQGSSGEQSKATAALPSDPEALRTYTEGVAKLRLFDALGARELLERAVALAPNFALPHVGLARAWELLGYDEKARGEAKLAVQQSGGLPPREQRSIEAEYHEMNSQWDQAISIYEALWVLYPDEPDYALALANAQTSAGKGQAALGTLAKLGSEQQMKDDPRVELSVALAAESLADTQKQRDAAQDAAEKATRQESRLLAAHAYWQLCSAYYALGEYQKGEAACNSSNGAAPFDDEIKARSQTVWANIMEARGNIPEALSMRRQALDTARKLGSQKDMIGALQNLADMLSSQGNAKEARADYDEAFRIAQAIGDKLGLVKLENSLANDLSANGDFTDAQAMYQRSLQTAREIGDKGGIAMALENLSSIQLQQGHLTEAQDNARQALALQQEAELQGDRPFALRALGDFFLVKGDFAKAGDNYDESLRLSTEQSSPAAIAASRAALAGLKLAEDKPSEAESLARQAAEEFSAEKLVDSEADARNTLARALIEEGKLTEARSEANRGLKHAPQDRIIRLSLAITDARLKGHEGRKPEARKELADSLAEADKMALASLRLEIKLAQAELETPSDPGLAKQRLHEVEDEARAKGYLLLASHAQRSRNKLAP